MELEKQIEDIEKQMPGLKEHLKTRDYGGLSGCYNKELQDLTYTETGKYKIALAKWHTEFSGGRSATVWSDYIVLYCMQKDSLDIQKTTPIYFPDMRVKPNIASNFWPWSYKRAGLEVISDNVVETSFMDENGDKNPVKRVCLE